MLDFKIKICGITNPADAVKAIEFGADAIGLNFYNRSLRSIGLERADEIAAVIPDNIGTIGVFVNEKPARINDIDRQLNLNAVQLHGDETPEDIELIAADVIRAIRVVDHDYHSAQAEVSRWQDHGVVAVLIDSGSQNQYGGTGKTLDWGKIADLGVNLPLILAGGLDYGNVANAISIVRPFAVDVASGIEKFPGAKDYDSMRRFVMASKTAFSLL